MRNLLVKKTTELTGDEINQINALFNHIFKRARTETEFMHQYLNTPLGYSYHVILKEDNELIGFHSGIPFYYLNNDKQFLVGLGVDTMTAEGHRDFFNVRDMFTACEKAMRNDGCLLRIGFPNDNSYPILKKGFKYKDIGKLDTFFLPIKIGGIKNSLRFLNPLSKFFAWVTIQFSKLSRKGNIIDYQYKKERLSFDKVRYKWFDEDYQKIDKNGVITFYKVHTYNGVKTAFILDVYPRNKNLFDDAVREVYYRESHSIDLIMYVGHLSFKPMSLIRMPHKYEPKHFNFTCKPLTEEIFDDSLFKIENWDVNLSNYDLI